MNTSLLLKGDEVLSGWPDKKGRGRKESALPFIQRHKRDIEGKMGALWRVLQEIDSSPMVMYDWMAGCGFTGRILEARWPSSQLWLNDLDPTCFKLLSHNFPNSKVTNLPVQDLKRGEGEVDLLFMDFNSFTVRKMKFWIDVLNRISEINPKEFILVDSASYAFKFGNNPGYSNVGFLTSYGLKDFWDYYGLLDERLKEGWGWCIHNIAPFRNAAVIHSKKEINGGEIRELKSQPITFKIFSHKGFGI